MQSYQEALSRERMKKCRELLGELPIACSDFINSIVMTTSDLTRLAYVLDMQTFCTYAYNEIPHFSERLPKYWNDSDFALFTSRDLQRFSEYLTLYYKSSDSESDEIDEKRQKVLINHEYGVMRKLSSLRSFFEYLFKNERIPGNIATLVSLPKLHEKPILYLIGSEIERLLNTASTGEGLTEHQKSVQKNTRKRDLALLMLFLGTGMRVSECVGIDIGDFDFASNGVLVTRKGGNQVILYYPDDVREALLDYWEERKHIQVANEDSQAFFLSLQRKRISQRAVQIMVKKYSSIAVPLKKRMSPHKLRSTYATRLYDETQDIYLVAESLGHADVNTTRRHYAAMSEERRKEAAKNVHLPKLET